MQPTFPGEGVPICSSLLHQVCAGCAVTLLALAGCGSQGGTGDAPAASPPAAAANTAGTKGPSAPAAPAVDGKGQSDAAAADNVVRQPATVAEAAQALDLATFPLVTGAKEASGRTLAHLSYEAPGDVKTAFEFQRKNLLAARWRELPDAQITDQSASASFGKDGFHVSVSVFPAGMPGHVSIMLQNHGNVNLKKLPVPPGAKLQYDFPAITSFITNSGAEETTAAVRKLLVDQGWAPYGSAEDTQSFKQNAIQLDVRVLSPPAEPGKTVINFSSQQLSADLPAPPDAEHVQYADPLKQLNLEAAGPPEEVVAFYQKALAPAGWKATSENAIQDGFESFMIFRNPAKDMLTLTLRHLQEQKQTRVTLRHQSAAEVAETERKIDAQIAAKKKRDDEAKRQPKPQATVTLPAGADEVQATATRIEFQVASGTGQAAVAVLVKELEAAGWKAEPAEGNAMVGSVSLQKGRQTIDIDHVDPGVIPAEITIAANGVELERKGE